MAAEEGSERDEEDIGLVDVIGLEEEEEVIYTKLSNDHVKAMLTSYLGPIDV